MVDLGPIKPRDDEEVILPPPHPPRRMRRGEGWLGRAEKLGKAMGTIVGILAALGAGGKYLLDWVLEERDAKIVELEERVSALTEDVLSLKERALLGSTLAIDTALATRERFHAVELAQRETQGSIAALRTEIRIRHEASVSSAQIEAASSQSDAHAVRSVAARPRGDPLANLVGLENPY